MNAAAQRVLVTGAAGFAGQHALKALAQAGVDALLGIGRGTTSILPPHTAFQAVDLDNRAGLAACLREFQPTLVLHLAAQASVGRAIGASLQTWRTNVAGLLNLAESMLAELRDATLIFVSSSEVYGHAFLSGKPLAEDVIVQPANVYARTKRAGEEMLVDLFAGSPIRLITRI